MNVHEILDRMEYLVHNSRQVPLTKQKVIDEAALLALIDELHQSLPADIREARWTVEERERLLQEAQREASRIGSAAAQRADKMLQTHELVQQAQARAQAMVREAEQRALQIRKAADDYAAEVMEKLEGQLMRIVATVKKGLEALKK